MGGVRYQKGTFMAFRRTSTRKTGGRKTGGRTITVTGGKLQQLATLLGIGGAKSAKVSYSSGGAKKKTAKKGAKKKTAKRK